MNKKWFLILFLSLVCIVLNAQEKPKVQWLYSMVAGVKNGLNGDPRAQSFCYEIAWGIRLKPGIQLEIPLISETKWELKGDNVLGRNLSTGIAIGYHRDASVLGPFDIAVSVCPDLLKGTYAGAEIGIKARMFLDTSEQAFLVLGGGRFFQYGGNQSSYFIQAGVGIRLKRPR